MSTVARLAGIAASGILFAVAMNGEVRAQDRALPPTSGSHNLQGRPGAAEIAIPVRVGGPINTLVSPDVRALIGYCPAYVTQAPNVILHFAADLPGYQPGFYVESNLDTTLLILGPDNTWRCGTWSEVEDEFGDYVTSDNPQMLRTVGTTGAWYIWVGTVTPETGTGSLFIQAIESQ